MAKATGHMHQEAPTEYIPSEHTVAVRFWAHRKLSKPPIFLKSFAKVYWPQTLRSVDRWNPTGNFH